MALKGDIAQGVRRRLMNPDLLAQIAHSVQMIRAGAPLRAEPDQARRVRRVQAVTGLDRVRASKVAAEPSGAEAVRGEAADFLGAAFLERGARAVRAVARIAFRDGSSQGTGFLISPRLLLTNNHVIPTEEAAHGLLAEFDFELGIDRQQKEITRFDLAPEALFITDDQDDLDYTIVALGDRISGHATVADLGCCPLSAAPDKHALGDSVNIAQHPSGRPKEVVVRENRLVARQPLALHYLADTEGGSSGSPVFNDQWEVVALHHWGTPHREIALPDGTKLNKDVNEGLRASAIVKELEPATRKLKGRAKQLLVEALQLGSGSLTAPRPASSRTERLPAEEESIGSEGRAETLVFLLADDPAPAGYLAVGSFNQVLDGETNEGPGSRIVRLRVYRKNF